MESGGQVVSEYLLDQMSLGNIKRISDEDPNYPDTDPGHLLVVDLARGGFAHCLAVIRCGHRAEKVCRRAVAQLYRTPFGRLFIGRYVDTRRIATTKRIYDQTIANPYTVDLPHRTNRRRLDLSKDPGITHYVTTGRIRQQDLWGDFVVWLSVADHEFMGHPDGWIRAGDARLFGRCRSHGEVAVSREQLEKLVDHGRTVEIVQPPTARAT